MFFAFRLFIYGFFFISYVYADDYENKYYQKSKLILENKVKIENLNTKIISHKLKSVDIKKSQNEKHNLILENFKLQIEKKNHQKTARQRYSKLSEKIKLRYSPKGICKNPCSLTLEAIASKKSSYQIKKYIFYINEKPIESDTPKISTTIYFTKSMLTDRQSRLLTKNIPIHKIFKIRVEGIISDVKMLESETKKIVLKSLPSNLTNIELITQKVMPFGKIQIVTNGIISTKLEAFLNGTPLSFVKDTSAESSHVLHAMAPSLVAGSYQLVISNFIFNIEILQLPTVMTPTDYISNISNIAKSHNSLIVENERFSKLLGNDGITLFSKYNDVILAFENYIKNEATSSEIQEIANIINANIISDSEAYFFVSNNREPIHHLVSNLKRAKLFSKFLSEILKSSYAQENPQNLLKNLLFSRINEAIKFTLTVTFNTIIDGMIDQCYVSKGRIVPTHIVKSEKYITFSFSMAVGGVIANQLGAGIGYYSAITAAQALVVLIGNDCEGDTTINPKLVIQMQPIAPIYPGESFSYAVKCDVGDSRYYTPGSILTRVTSKFDYISEELKETGDLIVRDELVHSCSGFGLDSIKDTHNIQCNSNLLEETNYYKTNSSQYEVINPNLCNGNDSYDVGTYLVSSPDFSCNFVNPENNVNIIGKKVIANQLVFDLSKKMQCPPKPRAYFTYSKNNLFVNFDSSHPDNENIEQLTYQWNFGDGTTQEKAESTISHQYSSAGPYNVTLKVVDKYGISSSFSQLITVETVAPSYPLAVITIPDNADEILTGRIDSRVIISAQNSLGDRNQPAKGSTGIIKYKWTYTEYLLDYNASRDGSISYYYTQRKTIEGPNLSSISIPVVGYQYHNVTLEITNSSGKTSTAIDGFNSFNEAPSLKSIKQYCTSFFDQKTQKNLSRVYYKIEFSGHDEPARITEYSYADGNRYFSDTTLDSVLRLDNVFIGYSRDFVIDSDLVIELEVEYNTVDGNHKITTGAFRLNSCN